MSEFLQNDPEKQAILKSIIKRLHHGESAEQVKRDFSRLVRNVSSHEIASMEQELIREGLPVSEVQRLCDVHIDLFKATMTKEGGRAGKIPGHPVHTYVLENRAANSHLKALKKRAKALRRGGEASALDFARELRKFSAVENHYARKENQLFPFLERVGFTGPSKVMWGKHDEIRESLKRVQRLVDERSLDDVPSAIKELTSRVKNMIFMEERILYPNALKRLSDSDWVAIRRGESDIGYAWVEPGTGWDDHIVGAATGAAAAPSSQPVHIALATGSGNPGSPAVTVEANRISLDTGALSAERINLMLKNLPIDITYVDENNTVLYYSAGNHRVFPRSPGIIGRDVHNCHPPKSVHAVEKIIESFRNKQRDVAEFWIPKGDLFVFIRYFPIYDDAGDYRGVIEVSQDVAPIRALEGERRLLDW